MTVAISQVHLLNVELGKPEPAELWHSITEKNLGDWEAEWMPEQTEAIRRLNREGVERRRWPQDRHWNWHDKMAAIEGMLGNPCFSIVCGGMTQGMMILDTVKRRCRIDAQKDKHLVYVEYVENAPWNRADLFGAPRYKGVGSILIRAAVELSDELEFHGRVGLHSLPQANAFYANTCGMEDLGADPDYQNLRYFEMTPEQAREFVAKGSRG